MRKVRPYTPADEEPAIELWRQAWQAAYPDIDFAARVPWWRKRWRDELVPATRIVIIESDGMLEGFVAVDPRSGYLDQIVVAPALWGSDAGTILIEQAKLISPARLELLVNKDNGRAIHFYEKHGFKWVGDDVNPVSGRPVYRMSWKA